MQNATPCNGTLEDFITSVQTAKHVKRVHEILLWPYHFPTARHRKKGNQSKQVSLRLNKDLFW